MKECSRVPFVVKLMLVVMSMLVLNLSVESITEDERKKSEEAAIMDMSHSIEVEVEGC